MDSVASWRLFIEVARLRSFVRAAERLRVSPQSATRAVAELEHKLGCKLLHRTTRSVSLTDDGERALERARRAIDALEQLQAPLADDAPLTGVLSITAPVLFGQLHVLPVVVAFLEKHRDLEVRLALHDRVVSLADEGIDLAVRIGALPDSALRARRLGEVRSVLCASPSYLTRRGRPRNVEALTRHDCVAFTATTPIPDRWSFTQGVGRERRVAVRPRLVVNGGHAAIDAALAGLGIVRLFSYQVAEHVKAGRLRKVLESLEPEAVPVQFVSLPGGHSRAAAAFSDFATPALAGRLRGI